MPKQIRFPDHDSGPIYANAVDSITRAIEDYALIQEHKEAQRYKYTVLHLAQGALLLMKECLNRKHPDLILADDRNDIKTVDFEQLKLKLKRRDLDLASYVGYQEWAGLVSDRNSIEHRELDLKSKDKADRNIAGTIVFLNQFLSKGWKQAHDLHILVGSDHWNQLLNTPEYIRHAKAVVRSNSKSRTKYECERCRANTALEDKVEEIVIRRYKPASGMTIRCNVCLQMVGFRSTCRKCGKEVTQKCSAPQICFCADCQSELQGKYPDIQHPRLLHEVQNFVRSAGQMSNWDLIRLQSFLGLPKDHANLAELIEKKYVTFTNKGLNSRFVGAVRKGKTPPEAALLGRITLPRT